MTDPRNEFERWEELLERRALHEPLSEDEQAFCTRFVTQHPECQAELDIYAELADLEARPNQASRALVDATLARMEREENDKERAEVEVFRTRRISPWAAATGVLAVAAALLAIFVRPSRQEVPGDLHGAPVATAARAELVYASGAVTVAGTGARVGKSLLSEGGVIETTTGTACVVLDPDINVCLSEHSRLRLSSLTTAARRLDLEAGKVAVRLSTQPAGMSLSIVAGEVWSTAVGTAFSVERGAADGAVITTVLNGKVRVGQATQGRVVAAHERSSVKAAHSEFSTVSRAEEAPSWAMLGPTVLWDDPVAATLEVHGEPSGGEAWLNDQRIGLAPLSTLVPVGAHRLIVRSGGAVLFDQEVRVNAGETRAVEYRRAVSDVPAQQAVAEAPKALFHAPKSSGDNAKVLTPEQLGLPAEAVAPLSPGLMLGQARKLIREQRYADAARVYGELRTAFPDSDEAHTVLVSLGQLELAQLRDPRQALRDLDSYLERGGPLSEEARMARVAALRALHDDAREAVAIEEFLAKHPRSLEAAELGARLRELRPQR